MNIIKRQSFNSVHWRKEKVFNKGNAWRVLPISISTDSEWPEGLLWSVVVWRVGEREGGHNTTGCAKLLCQHGVGFRDSNTSYNIDPLKQLAIKQTE